MALPDPQQHQVIVMLSLPRSAAELSRLLVTDPNAQFETIVTVPQVADQATEILLALEQQQYARSLGIFETAEKVVEAIAKDDSLVVLPDEKAASYVERTNDREAYKLREGTLWYWTVTGREAALG